MKTILISDATLRDGNHAAKHQLKQDDFIRYCQSADRAGIPIVEVGHGNGLGASSAMVGFAAVPDHEILQICRQNLKKSKLGVHIIPGFATIKNDIVQAIDYGVDVFRVGSHCTEANITQKHIEYIRKMNRLPYGALMMSHMTPIDNLVNEAKKMESYGAEGVVIMDSAGNYVPHEVTDRISALVDNLSIAVGFHGHNNLGLAIGNSIAAVNAGATILDGSVCGYGAGSGNTQLEVLIAVLQKLKFETNVNFGKMLDLAELVESTLTPLPPHVSTLSLISGISGVFSGFSKHVLQAAKEYNVDSRQIFIELGKRKALAGQENLIIEVAQELQARTSKEEYQGF